MKFLALLVVSLIALSGCNSANTSRGPQRGLDPQAAAELDVERNKISEQAKAGKISWVQAKRQEIALIKSTQSLSPQMEAYWAQQLVIAEMLDKKQITLIQADAMNSEAKLKLIESYKNSQATQTVRNADQGAAVGNALQQSGNTLIMLDQQRMMNQPINARCNTFMGTTNCQTW